jgi:hypothetical protein
MFDQRSRNLDRSIAQAVVREELTDAVAESTDHGHF